ncbi:sterol desaturase family protein [Lacimicrobium sp. SS2-24]|uniref:sterol desaturase family protein n=1 Tax=Lacimicrobium sp. SS2-24 TaxID=2005569 RepID=UPI000B4B8B11|nr:sterol desaturase family protein [Lacimicrobium sp. SS2-24]
MKTMSPAAIRTFREHYRAKNIGRLYSGYVHFGFTITLCLVGMGLCLTRLESVTMWEWLTIPVTFLYANLAEYFGHKGPMHKPVKGLQIIFERHAKQHHRFFTDQTMAFDNSRDFHAVLFPPVMLLFFIGVFALPVGMLLAWLMTPNVGYLFAFTGIAYFLNYEVFHFIFHVSDTSFIYRIPGMRRLRQLHQDHHRLDWMSQYNFNITYPIGDWLFGTLKKESQVQPLHTQQQEESPK